MQKMGGRGNRKMWDFSKLGKKGSLHSQYFISIYQVVFACQNHRKMSAVGSFEAEMGSPIQSPNIIQFLRRVSLKVEFLNQTEKT